MPRYMKNDHTVETSNVRESKRLKAAGYIEQVARTKAVKQADAQQQTPSGASPTSSK